ncbi:hypothetical protein Nepgr_014878 [Nepenthes gracilis]|uniref:HSF-type DNA-binding domain-containing protein n=1 Tax=Nepenthes gracilis TaxID=150966 RepID=A0AAD3SM26_NEPGR|nr:hypothetical protein Nepgr_014878 [Nepenthes gracilis]
MAFMVERGGDGEMVFAQGESQKAAPPPFLTKTYQLVDDRSTNHIVSWGEDENSFVVWRPPEFARDLLPNYFKHNNFSSFVRQLNTYGFKKVVADRWEFANEYFRKGEKHLLFEIHRRKTPYNNDHSQNYLYYQDQLIAPPQFLHPDFDHHAGRINEPSLPSQLPPPKPPNDILTTMIEDNQRLRKRNFMLLSELNHMKSLYNDIIYFVQNHVKPVPNYNNNYQSRSTPTNSAPKLVELDDSSFQAHDVGEKKNDTIKLFGVPLQSKKRLHSDKIN